MILEQKCKFDGAILKRGFWLYVCKIKYQDYILVYVGRTGDSSTKNAASLFSRIARHFDPKGKGNSILRNLQKEGIDAFGCHYEFLGFFIVKEEKEKHEEYRDEVAAMECRLYNDLIKRRFRVLGVTRSKKIFPSQKEAIYKMVLEKAVKFLQTTYVK